MVRSGERTEARLPWAEAARFPFREPVRYWLPGLTAALVAAWFVADALPVGIRAAFIIGVVIAVWVTTLRIATRSLLAAAAGARTRRELLEQDVEPGVPGRLVALWLLGMTPASAALGGAGGLLAVLLAAACLAVLPLATLVLARRASFVDALDPILWRETVGEIGVGVWLRLTGALLFLGAGYLLLAAPDWPERLGWLRNGLQAAYWIWAMLAWFHLAGRAIAAPRQDAEPDPAPDRLDLDALFERLLRRGGTRAEHRRLADGLRMAGDRARLIEHGRVHVNALMDGFEQPERAVEVADGLIAEDPGFCMADTESMYRLVRQSMQHGHPALTIRLCANYLEGFPQSFKCDEVRLLGCEAAAAGDAADRRATAPWLKHLAAAELADDQRARLKRIVPAFRAGAGGADRI
jgi:hypothetical protein